MTATEVGSHHSNRRADTGRKTREGKLHKGKKGLVQTATHPPKHVQPHTHTHSNTTTIAIPGCLNKCGAPIIRCVRLGGRTKEEG
jgi:hypothetical protein